MVTLAGILIFASGTGLRVHAMTIASRLIRNGSALRDGDSWTTSIIDATHANALYDIAVPMLWTGAALIVLAAIVFLLPLFRHHPDEHGHLLPSHNAR